jgi:hypoxanthine-guanine phosphoribosyltransferase
MRNIDLPVTIDFIAVSSYGDATKTAACPPAQGRP